MVLHKSENLIDYASYIDGLLVTVAGSAFLSTVLSRRRARWEDRGSLPKKQYGICAARYIVGMLSVERRLQELIRQGQIPCTCV